LRADVRVAAMGFYKNGVLSLERGDEEDKGLRYFFTVADTPQDER
jgi:hypothetical protein